MELSQGYSAASLQVIIGSTGRIASAPFERCVVDLRCLDARVLACSDHQAEARRPSSTVRRSSRSHVLRLAGFSNQSFDPTSREAMPDIRSSARWIAFMSYLPQSGNACGSRPSATQMRNVASSRPISAAACASLTSRGVDGTGRDGSATASIVTSGLMPSGSCLLSCSMVPPSGRSRIAAMESCRTFDSFAPKSEGRIDPGCGSADGRAVPPAAPSGAGVGEASGPRDRADMVRIFAKWVETPWTAPFNVFVTARRPPMLAGVLGRRGLTKRAAALRTS